MLSGGKKRCSATPTISIYLVFVLDEKVFWAKMVLFLFVLVKKKAPDCTKLKNWHHSNHMRKREARQVVSADWNAIERIYVAYLTRYGAIFVISSAGGRGEGTFEFSF